MIYTYNANSNTLFKSTLAHSEEAANSTFYAYNTQGIRTAKPVNSLCTAFLLDGSDVVAEVQNNLVTNNYLCGVNLIRRETTSETEYYLFNAHGDVVTTTNPNGTINQSYDYDAFGVEKDPDTLDTNPFRYLSFRFNSLLRSWNQLPASGGLKAARPTGPFNS